MNPIFLNPTQLAETTEFGPSVPMYSRGQSPEVPQELLQEIEQLQRGAITGDINSIVSRLGMTLADMSRAITTSTSAFPVREDLEAPARLLIPVDTPVRNMLPRTIGAGTASAWKQMTTTGGGWGGSCTSTASGNTAATTITVDDARGFYAGDTIIIDPGATTSETRIIASVNYSTNVITMTVATANTQNSKAIKKAGFQPGGGSTVTRAFFAESGAPADHATAYANKSASYKLMGTYGSVTGFAMAAGANFQNQLAMEKTNAIRTLMLNEENALINGDATAIVAPWGDGTNALAFNGLLNLVTTANGCPADQVQTAVGALTVAHLDSQLSRLWIQGAQGLFMIMNEQECRSLTHLAEGSGSIIRVQATADGKAVLGVKVTGFMHAVSGQMVDIIPSRFMPAGTILFGARNLPDGSPTADVRVLPQVQLPELAPNQSVQGYVAQEIAPTTSAPQVYPFIVTVFEVLRLKSAYHWAKSSGITAV
jgi:hypothetical protein